MGILLKKVADALSGQILRRKTLFCRRHYNLIDVLTTLSKNLNYCVKEESLYNYQTLSKL